jgi:hypothetical protein
VTARARARERRGEQERARKAAAAKARAEAAAAPVTGESAVSRAQGVLLGPRPVLPVPVPEPGGEDVVQELVLEDLTREQAWTGAPRAARDHPVVFDHIEKYGEVSARRLFTGQSVNQVQRLSGLGHLNLGHTPWGKA